MEGPPLASLSLTHVYYDPSDPISHACAWLALVPQCLCIVYATLIWSTREIEILLLFGGQMGCEALNFLLKRFIREERPPGMRGKGYGMPSSHSQFLAFWAVSLILFVLVRHRPAQNTHSERAALKERQGKERELQEKCESTNVAPLSVTEKALAILFVACLATAVASSRVYLNYHTPRQVGAGVLAGVICAVCWFGLTEILRRTGWIDWVLELDLVKFFRMRDLIVGEDLCHAGWIRWQGRKKRKAL